MDSTPLLDRFDWNGWLATIPGIPADWGLIKPADDDAGQAAPDHFSDFAQPLAA